MIAKLMKLLPGCLLLAAEFPGAAGSWNYWGHVNIDSYNTFPGGAQLAADGANLYYSTAVQGIYYAPLWLQYFGHMPMTGFPLWDENSNTNGFGVYNIATSAQGTVVISGLPVNINVASNSLSPSPAALTNTLPVFYWWDATNGIWQPAAISNKSYPYTVTVGNFVTASDGALWTCSGFSPYAYRSTDGGQSYTAIDINASVPPNYFPIPLSGGVYSFGKLFSITAGWNNEIVIGTETGGFLYTTNNGKNWASLDPNFTDTNSANPLGRIGNASVAGIDRHGYFLCNNVEMPACPAKAAWGSVPLIGYRPQDGTYFNASGGLIPQFIPSHVLTTQPAGVTFTYMNQNYLLQGGVFEAPDGANWHQNNQGSPVGAPFPDGITNVAKQGNCITTLSNLVFIGSGNDVYYYDSTPLPITNRPPIALPQNVNLLQNSSANFTLAGADADGDPLHFTVTTPPVNGSLGGTPPNLTYISPKHFVGVDSLQFVADDGMATSAPVVVNFTSNSNTSQPPTVVSFTATGNQQWLAEPTNIILSATATAANGIQHVDFYNGTNLISSVQNPPYHFTWTNPPPGDYVLSACVVDTQQAATWSQPNQVLVLPATPALQIFPSAGPDMNLTWPVTLDDFYVETATNAGGPWTLSPVPQSYFTNGQMATIPAANCQQFYRLERIR